MGAYGIGTTCGLCGRNHQTRSDAIKCAELIWNRVAVVFTDTEDAPITHEPTPLVCTDELLDLEDLSLEAWSMEFRRVVTLASL